MPTTVTQPVRVFISHSHDDNAACVPLLAALTALGVDYWFDTERLDAGTNLSTRIQAAITERDYFIRVCSSNVQRNPYWVDLETGAFRASQAQASKTGRPNQRVLIPFILDSGYAIQPFEQAVLYIDAAHESVAVWTAQLRRALGLGDAANAPHAASAGPYRPPSGGATRVVDWRHGAGDHTTITDAIAAAQPGERILIRRGVYTESLIVAKPLELVGDGDRDDVTIEASDATVIAWSAANGLIANLTLRQLGGNYFGVNITQGAPDLEDCDISSQGNSCVAVNGAGARPRVRRNRIHDSKASGIWIFKQGSGLIEDNDIFANAYAGVSISNGGAPTVRRNRIHDGQQGGVFVYEQGLGVIEDNDIFANTFAGVIIQEGSNPILRSNRIHDGKQSGVFVQQDGQGVIEDNDIFANTLAGVSIAQGGNPTVRRNRIHDSRQSGVFVNKQGRGVIEDNDIFANAHAGVTIQGEGSAPTVRRNRINKNIYEAVWVYEGAGGVFEQNDLRDNTRGAWDISADSAGNVTRRDNQE